MQTLGVKSVARWFASAGGILAVLAPKGLCPVCIAASGGLLTSLGLGFLATETSIRWLLVGALLVGLTGLVLTTRRHRRWWTFGLGALGACFVMAGRLAVADVALYVGMLLLLGATLADVWARRHPFVPLVQIRLKGVSHAQSRDL